MKIIKNIDQKRKITMNQFKRENLQENDIIILRDESIFMLYKFDNDLHLISRLNTFHTISNYNDNLKHQNNSDYDIVEIKRPDKPQNLIYSNWEDAPTIWKRQEKPIPSNDEYIILKNIDSDYKYIARDKSGSLFLYDTKPTKYDKQWDNANNETTGFTMYSNLFKFIKWRDEKPYLIQDLLKDYKDYKDNK